MAHGTEKQLPHRAPEVMGLESMGSIDSIEVEGTGEIQRPCQRHIEVEETGEIQRPCSELGFRAGSLRVAKPQVATSSEEYEVIRDKAPERKNSHVPDGHP